MEWVYTSMPFGIDRAERLMAVTKAFGTCPPDVRDRLPAGWTVLFELSRLPTETFQRCLNSGRIGPTMTVMDAKDLSGEHLPTYRRPAEPREPHVEEYKLTSDLVATELIRLPRRDLSETVESLLREWIDGDQSQPD